MRVWELQHAFGLDALAITERPTPSPGPGEVRVQVKATSLNYRDLLMVQGLYNPKQPLPLIPVSDGAGVIDAVGPGVSQVKVGDRVMGLFAQRWFEGGLTREKAKATLGGPLDGLLAEHVILPETGVVAIPEHLNFQEAATLPIAALTAWSALVDEGQLKPGDTVLIQGTGGVSLFALQLAKAIGARTILLSSSDEKLARAKTLGADEILNYVTTPQWDRAVLDLTEGQGVDHVIEVGGANTLSLSMNAVRHQGAIHVIGILSGAASQLNVLPVLMKRIRLQGIYVASKASFEAMNKALSQLPIHPVIDRIFPFEEAVSAFEYLQSGRHFGKIVINVD